MLSLVAPLFGNEQSEEGVRPQDGRSVGVEIEYLCRVRVGFVVENRGISADCFRGRIEAPVVVVKGDRQIASNNLPLEKVCAFYAGVGMCFVCGIHGEKENPPRLLWADDDLVGFQKK